MYYRQIFSLLILSISLFLFFSKVSARFNESLHYRIIQHAKKNAISNYDQTMILTNALTKVEIRYKNNKKKLQQTTLFKAMLKESADRFLINIGMYNRIMALAKKNGISNYHQTILFITALTRQESRTTNMRKLQQITALKRMLQKIADHFIFEDKHKPHDQKPLPQQKKEISLVHQNSLSTIINQSYILGSSDATIIILEYADIQCPECQRHKKQNTIDTLLQNFSGTIQYSFQHFPLDSLSFSKQGAKMIECFVADIKKKQGQQQATKLFYQLLEKIYDGNSQSLPTLLPAMIQILGGDEKIVTACSKQQPYQQGSIDTVDISMGQGKQLFSIQSSPSFIIIDKKTRQWTMIQGSYPYESFEAEIKKILEKN